ncbi:MAG: protein TolR [Burkholderiales bacterium]|nr:protein TolR [Burkholderiales bacterium]
MPGVVPRGRGRRAMNEINMVPFIDVMLVLLIIFMVTAPLITTGVVDLPSVGAARQADARVVEVIVARDGALALRLRGADGSEAQPVALRQLAARVRELQRGAADMPVVISADRRVEYDAVMGAMRVLQRAGVQRVGLSVAQGR